MVGREVGR
jgi:hypothetical protein